MSEEQVKQRSGPISTCVRTIQFALALAAAVLAGCASRTESLYTTTSPPTATGPSLTSAAATLSMAPSIDVGDVTAVYVTVTNESTGSDPLSVTLMELRWPRAVDESGSRVDRLDAEQAIQKAGGADKLLAALGNRGNAVDRPLAHKIADYTPLAIWSPVLVVADLAARAYSSLQAPGSQQRLKVEAKEFQLYPTRLAPFAFTYAGSPVEGLPPLWSEKGYVFFPRGSYTALEMTVRKFEEYDRDSHSGPLESVMCRWQ